MARKSVAIKKDAKQENLLDKIRTCMTEAGWHILREFSKPEGCVELIVALQSTPRDSECKVFIRTVQEVVTKIGVEQYKCTMKKTGKEGDQYPVLCVSFVEVVKRIITTTRVETVVNVDIDWHDRIDGTTHEEEVTRSIDVEIYVDVLRASKEHLV